MPETYRGADFDIENKWMFEMCVDMVGPETTPSYLSPDGKWLLVEANCYLRTLWSGHEGHYTQRELYIWPIWWTARSATSGCTSIR